MQITNVESVASGRHAAQSSSPSFIDGSWLSQWPWEVAHLFHPMRLHIAVPHPGQSRPVLSAAGWALGRRVSRSPPGVPAPTTPGSFSSLLLLCWTLAEVKALSFRKRAKVKLLHNKGCHLCTVHRMVNCPGLYRSSFSKLILLRSIRAMGAAKYSHPRLINLVFADHTVSKSNVISLGW